MSITNTRKEKIETFLLERYSELDKVRNNNISLHNWIYSKLKNYNLNKEDIDYDIRNNYPNWENYYKNKKNIMTFRNYLWNNGYFLQFINEDYSDDIINSCEPIKLYIPLKKENIYENTKIIIDYLARENIKHTSKICGTNRTDQLVLRIKGIEDAKKVINFVNFNEQIRKNVNEVNPFVMNVGIVGVSQDNFHSYNSEVANLIANYLLDVKNKNNVPSLDGLIEYTKNHKLVSKDVNCHGKEEIYMEEIRKMILISLESGEFSEFEKLNNSSIDNKQNKQQSEILSDLEIMKRVREHIRVTVEKYGDKDLKERIENYLRTNNVNMFSRINTNGVLNRDVFIAYPDKVKEMLRGMIKEKDIFKFEDLMFLVDACKETSMKHPNGYDAYNIFKTYIYSNDATYITRKSIDGRELRSTIERHDNKYYQKLLLEYYGDKFNIQDCLAIFEEEFRNVNQGEKKR